MGSFAYTCAVSGLPIEAGDEVRYLLLTKNPYHSGAENTCYIHDLWFPRTFPLKAEYNDYGSIENYADGPEQDIWLEGFKRDMVERGWGENTCHDIPTSKEMKFAELLDAIQEGRVLVERETSDYRLDKIDALLKRTDKLLGKEEEQETLSPEEKRDRSISSGVPTMYRIRKVAEKLEIPIYDARFGKKSIIIDSPKAGEVRIRCHAMYGYKKIGADEKFVPGAAIEEQIAVLTKLQDNLTEYATMISTSSDACGVTGEDGRTYTQPDTEMIIRPKPGTRNGVLSRRDKKEPLPVGHCMIREDVWQALIKQTAYSWDGKATTIDKFNEGINKFVADQTNVEARELRWFRMNEGHKYHGAWIVSKDEIPFTVGLATHFQMMMDKGQLTPEFLKTVAEFAFITSLLANTRYQWRTSSSAGPQFGEWEAHETLLKTLTEVAHVRAEEEKAKRAEWESYKLDK